MGAGDGRRGTHNRHWHDSIELLGSIGKYKVDGRRPCRIFTFTPNENSIFWTVLFYPISPFGDIIIRLDIPSPGLRPRLEPQQKRPLVVNPVTSERPQGIIGRSGIVGLLLAKNVP